MGQATSIRAYGNYNHISYHKEIRIEGVLGDVQFTDANLEDATPPSFESPVIAGRLVADLEKLRLLVLSGIDAEDKPLLARHLAWLLQERASSPLPVKEWNQPRQAIDIDGALHKINGPSILLLRDARPFHLGHNLRRLHEVVCNHGHFAILTTEDTSAQWSVRQGGPEERYWRNLRTEDVYDADYLVEVLRSRLQEVGNQLPRNLLPQGLEAPHAAFMTGMALRELAGHFRTPHSIRSFVHLLCSAPEEIERKEVDQLIGQLREGEHSVRTWYRQSDSRRQLLAFGLSVFEGLFDDQVFAGLEKLVSTVWRHHDPAFAQFDYHEIASLEAYFLGTSPGLRTRRIEIRQPKVRAALIESAWELNRRHVLAVLPLLADLLIQSAEHTSRPQASSDRWGQKDAPEKEKEPAKESRQKDEKVKGKREKKAADGPEPASQGDSAEASLQARPADREEARLSGWAHHSLERELFGSESRAAQLWGTISEILSQVGVLSFNAVEPLLLRLAAHPRTEVKMVVAAALAELRSVHAEDGEEQLFEVLNRWQDDASEVLQAFVDSEEDKRVPLAQIRATVALALGFVAQHEISNEMTERMRDLFLKLVKDKHPIVRKPFRQETLPSVVAKHPEQLEPLLRQEVVLHVDLLGGLALGLATACALRPGIALPILDRWYQESRAEPAVTQAYQEPSARETLLVTVVLAYGNLDVRHTGNSLLFARVFGRLRTVLSEENHPFVRRAVVWGAKLQARRNFSKVSSLLQDLAGEIALDERHDLIQELTQVYLDQRAALEDGDDVVMVQRREFHIWIHRERPLTEVESILYKWLRDERRPPAQQLAMDCLVSFLDTELERQERERANREAFQRSPAFEAGTIKIFARKRASFRKSALLYRLLSPVVNVPGEKTRNGLRVFIPEIIHCWMLPGGRASLLLLEKWRGHPDPDIQQLGAHLDRSLWDFRFRGAFVLLLLVLLFSLI